MKNPLRIVSIFVVGVVSTVIGVEVAAQPLRQPVTIVNHGSGLCLEPNGSGWGEPILQQPCDPMRPAQRWHLKPDFLPVTYSLIQNNGTVNLVGFAALARTDRGE